ncbi:DUF6950 family protein [Vibrio navarrensis]|uniref:DUF6950 family protein n=1 Tax=Vibrio navarrensis TaxID=29495 RepID=UPI0018698F4E|nr:hypothetical protein [Vibrio navarrensis]MBE4620985.1 hypothetical protein [Vibrio navarrensis]
MNKFEKLNAFLANYADKDFATGVNDCALFVSDWTLELTGEDLAAPFRGRYKTDLGSARLIKKLGYQSLEDLVSKEFDRVAVRRSSPLLAQRGDVAWIKGRKECVCGLVGPQGVIVLGENGLNVLPMSSIQTAWEIVS